MNIASNEDSSFDVVGKFGEGFGDGLNFPEGQNINDFPTLKKILGKK